MNLAPNRIVLPMFEGRRGHPVLFSSEVLEEILALRSSEGANIVVRRNPERIIEVPVNTERTEVLRDGKSGFISYVPIGSVKKGEALVNGGGVEVEVVGKQPAHDRAGVLHVPVNLFDAMRCVFRKRNIQP